MIDINQKTASWTSREYAMLAAKGFIVGAIDVVAGVSGGTMAIIVGIYADLLHALHRFDMRALRLALRFRIRELLQYIPWKFLSAVSVGVLVAVITTARVLEFFFETAPLYTWSALFGLVGASALFVRANIRKEHVWTWFCIIIGFIISYRFIAIIPQQTPDAAWFLFLTGVFAVCAALLPGLSGSFTLIILGKYQFILEAINTRDIPTLAIFGAGAVIGLLVFVRAITWLIDKHNDITMAILTGLMVGSMRKVWPWNDGYIGNTWIALLCMALGVAFVFGIHRLAKKLTPPA